MDFQEGETLSTVFDGKFWRPSDVGVCTYFGLFSDVRQSHVWYLPMKSHKDVCQLRGLGP